MRNFFYPESIALIGCSSDGTKPSGRTIRYLRKIGYEGAVYPVNPGHAQIMGTRCFTSLADVPKGTSLAVILLGADKVIDAVKQCGNAGIDSAIVVASGFGESTAEGVARQAELVETAARCGVRVIGPNCIGLLCPATRVAATWTSYLETHVPAPGRLALITQSGAIGNAVMTELDAARQGVHSWVSSGNECDVGALDVMEFLAGERDVDVIGLVLETVKDGQRFLETARKTASLGKRVVVFRTARSALGRAISVTHTGKLSGNAQVWDGIARQAGVVQASTLEEFTDLCQASVALAVSGACARGLGVVSLSGGTGVVAGDKCDEYGVPLPELSPGTAERLDTALPAQVTRANPIDAGYYLDAKASAQALGILLDDPRIDVAAVIASSTRHDYEVLTKELAEAAGSAQPRGKLVAAAYLAPSDRFDAAQRGLMASAGALVLPTVERLILALARLREPSESSEPSEHGRSPGQAPGEREHAPTLLGQEASGRVLDDIGVPRATARVVTDTAHLSEAARDVGYPVALKIASLDIPHKSDVGGVRLGLRDAAELAAAWEQMRDTVAARAPDARIEGATVERMAEGDGIELIVGCGIDKELGRFLMIGAGGLAAESQRDVAFCGLPGSRAEVERMLHRLRIGDLLLGSRGTRYDLRAAVDVIMAVQAAFATRPEIVGLDINPLIVLPEGRGTLAVDYMVQMAHGWREPTELQDSR
jgi:acetate---CoA ligase (ADP-forming)